MPTKRPRHTITETSDVERALRPLRARRPGKPLDLKELVILGAREKVARLDREGEEGERRRELLEQFVNLRADDVDVDALLEVHEHGWHSGR